MIRIGHFLIIFLYSTSLFMFGGYIRLVEIMDLLTCFICKEMDQLERTYDYIVVGCGSAGSVVAQRLAEDKHTRVLVLEAGPHGGSLLDIPAFGPMMQLSSVDWQYRTVPQAHASKAFVDQASNWPMGRIVGGSGRLNNMVYLRGHPSDYKEWYKDLPDFNYERDILSYFKKAENHRGIYKNDTKYHSTGGPLNVEDLSYVSPLAQAVLDAAELLGYPIRDLNGEYNTGFMQIQVNTHHSARKTPSHHLLIKHMPNLALRTNTLVEKVLLKSNYEAYAVQYTHLGQRANVRARKGVILSAGVVGTPKLLMLSGIGPHEHLNSVGIKTKVNLSVGNNLQDHITTGFDLVLLNTSLGIDYKSLMSPITAFDYFFHSSGPWTTVGCEVIGLVNTESRIYNYSKFNSSQQPDLQLSVIPVGTAAEPSMLLKQITGITDEVWGKYFTPLSEQIPVIILPVLLHPKSRGTVRLADKNIFSKPRIDPNYLSERYDVELLLKGIDLIKELIETEPMQKLGARLNNKKFTGCESHNFDSQKYWECYLRYLTLTSYHPIGTCKMGSKMDGDAVVDYNFQVHNTNKLYVADASVMPILPSSNPNVAVVMIGEKLADILKDHNYLSERKSHIKELFLTKRFMQTQANTYYGVRSTPASNFYVKNRPNLVLQTNTLVEKVLFKSNFEAYAVKYTYVGQRLYVHARKGIILSAGVIGSPKLLMLSGIGPRKHLDKIGIQTNVDLPVGNNLQDHLCTAPDFVLLKNFTWENSVVSTSSLYNYFYNSSGPLTFGGCEVLGVIDTERETYCFEYLDRAEQPSPCRTDSKKSTNKVKLKNATKTIDKYLPAARRYQPSKFVPSVKYNHTNIKCPLDETRQPNLQFMVLPFGFSFDHGLFIKHSQGITNEVWDSYFRLLVGNMVITIIPIVLHPKSRGTVRLVDKYVTTKPLIDPNYLADPYDLKILLKGIDLVKKFVKTEPMQNLGAAINTHKPSGCLHHDLNSQAYWKCYIRHFSYTCYHPVGTCKMGAADCKDSVVDYNFKIHGTNKLYVADASIMPTLPSANINAAIVMIGEKAADEVKYQNYLNVKKSRRTEALVPKSFCSV